MPLPSVLCLGTWHLLETFRCRLDPSSPVAFSASRGDVPKSLGYPLSHCTLPDSSCCLRQACHDALASRSFRSFCLSFPRAGITGLPRSRGTGGGAKRMLCQWSPIPRIFFARECSGKGQRWTLAASAFHLPFVRQHFSLNLEVTIFS